MAVVDKGGPPKSSRPGAVVIGSDFQSLGAIRNLAAHNVPIFVVEYELGISRFSRYVGRRVRKYDLFDDPGAIDYLLSLADTHKLDDWVLFPNNDETVKLLATHHATLSQRFRVPVPPWEITQQFYHKGRSYQLAADIGVATPTIYPTGTIDDLLTADIDFPVVLKPAFKENYYPQTKKKAVLARNRDELQREYEQMRKLVPATQIVVQEYITGGTRNLYSFACVFDGKQVTAGVTARRLRQHPMDFGHATTYAETVEIPELSALAIRLLSAMDYRGVAEVEFMFDERSGQYKFIEMNGRMWGWHTLSMAAGVDIPYALYCLMTDNPVPASHPLPARWIRLLTDTPTSLLEMLRGHMTVGTYWRTLRGGRMEYAVWSMKDPLPFMMEFAMLPYLWWKKGF